MPHHSALHRNAAAQRLPGMRHERVGLTLTVVIPVTWESPPPLLIIRGTDDGGGRPPIAADVTGERMTILTAVNALPQVGAQSYDGRAAARHVPCIRKEVPAMFTSRQTPPGVAL